MKPGQTIWAGYVDTREQAHESAKAAYRIAWQSIENGIPCTIAVTEMQEDISVRQRRFFHGVVLAQISEQVVVDGTRYTIDVWKEHLKSIFIPDKWEMHLSLIRDKKTGVMRKAKRKTPRLLRKSTERMGVKAYSEFIEKCIAHAATEWGVEFYFYGDEREAVRYKPQPKQAKAEKREEEHAVA